MPVIADNGNQLTYAVHRVQKNRSSAKILPREAFPAPEQTRAAVERYGRDFLPGFPADFVPPQLLPPKRASARYRVVAHFITRTKSRCGVDLNL